MRRVGTRRRRGSGGNRHATHRHRAGGARDLETGGEAFEKTLLLRRKVLAHIAHFTGFDYSAAAGTAAGIASGTEAFGRYVQ